VIGLALLTAGYGMWQSVAGMAPFEQRWLWEGYTDLGVPVLLQYGVLRAFSTFSDPHAYGFFLAGALLCLLGASLEEHAGRARHLGTAVVLSVALMLTLARAPWAVVAFGGMLIWALQRPDQRSVRVALLAILTLAVLVVPFAVQTTVKRIPSAFVRRALTTGTFVARTEAWRAFLVDSSLRPPLGYGMGMASYARRKFTGEIGPTPHNQLLAVLYETGWVGLLLFLWILARAFRCILSLVRQPPSLWPQLVPAVGYVAGITFVGLIMMNFWDSRIAASLFWLGLGAVSVASSGFQRREAVPT